jgi:hypothetical protein
MVNHQSSAMRIWLSWKDGWLSTAIIVALLGIILYQRWSPQETVIPEIAAGDRLPSIPMQNPSGVREELSWDTGRTLIYIFSPTCVWCQSNIEGLKRVLTHSDGYRTVGISLLGPGTDSYLSKNGINFSHYYIADRTVRDKFKFFTTPQTLIVNSDGVVQAVWSGAYAGRAKADVERTFGVSLPELVSVGQTSSYN